MPSMLQFICDKKSMCFRPCPCMVQTVSSVLLWDQVKLWVMDACTTHTTPHFTFSINTHPLNTSTVMQINGAGFAWMQHGTSGPFSTGDVFGNDSSGLQRPPYDSYISDIWHLKLHCQAGDIADYSHYSDPIDQVAPVGASNQLVDNL